MTSINLLNSGFLSMFFCTWATGFEVVILPKFLLFLVSHVFSVMLWFKAFYKSNLASFFVWGFSDGEEKNMCVCTCWCTPVCRQNYGRDVGWSKCCGPLGLSLVHICRQCPFVFKFRQACFFSLHGFSELGKFGKGLHMSRLSNTSRKIPCWLSWC